MNMTRFVVVVLAVLAGSTGLLIWMVNSPGSVVLPVVFTVYVFGEIALIMFGTFHWLWRPIARDYPPQPHGEDAVTRKCQSFSVGIINMSFSINATADATYLHLQPVTWLRVCGATPMSIPWSSLHPHGRTGRSARLGATKTVLHGPRWCMELVQASSPGDGEAQEP